MGVPVSAQIINPPVNNQEAYNSLKKQLDHLQDLKEKLQSNIVATKPLSDYQFKQISLNPKYFQKDTLTNFAKYDHFDELSKNFIRMISNQSEYDLYKNDFINIFNQFTGSQLQRHLNNLCAYIHTRANDRQEIIERQLLLLSVAQLMKAACACVGGDADKFKEHFWLSLETAENFGDIFQDDSLKLESVGSGIKKKFGELVDIFAGEAKNFLLADEILSTQCPTSIFDAQGVYSFQLEKYRTAGTIGGVFGELLPPPLKIFSLGALALPAIVSVVRRIYLDKIRTTPISVEPLSEFKKDHKFTSGFIGREELFESILNAWKQKKHPILVGEPGVGKTSIIMELGRRIANGEIPGFEGKALFCGSAALLTAPNYMGSPTIQRVFKTLLKYKENVVLALDEAHALGEDPNHLTLLRSVTDNSKDSLPYCLFATTTEGYKIFEDSSLKRRIVKIDVKALVKNELLYLLSLEAKLISPMLTIHAEVMEKLYEKAKGKQNETRQLLHKVLTHAETKNSGYPIFEKKHLKHTEIQLLLDRYKNEWNSHEEDLSLGKKIKEEKGELARLEEDCKYAKQIRSTYALSVETLVESKKKRLHYSKEIYEGINQQSGLEAKERDKIALLENEEFQNKHEKIMKNLLYLQFFDRPFQMESIKKFEKRHDLMSVIDKDAMEAFLKELEEEEKKTEDSSGMKKEEVKGDEVGPSSEKNKGLSKEEESEEIDEKEIEGEDKEREEVDEIEEALAKLKNKTSEDEFNDVELYQ